MTKPNGPVPEEEGYASPSIKRLAVDPGDVSTAKEDRGGVLTALGRYDRAAIDGLRDPGDNDRDEDYVPSTPEALYRDAEFAKREEARSGRFEATFGIPYLQGRAVTYDAALPENAKRVPMAYRTAELPEGDETTPETLVRTAEEVPFAGKFKYHPQIRVVGKIDADLAEALGIELENEDKKEKSTR